MKYHDSIAQANEKLSNAVVFLENHQLAPNPINYAVAYEYISEANASLTQMVSERLQEGLVLDSYFIESLYNLFLVKTADTGEALVSGVGSVVEDVGSAAAKASHVVGDYLESLDNGLVSLNENSADTSKEVISRLIDMTFEVKKAQQSLQSALRESKRQTESLQKQIQDIKHQSKLDPLTGLFNFSSMKNEVEEWLSQDPTRDIAAIAVDVDDFNLFNESFGYLVGDVVINKVARKIRHYCQESGLPVRTGGEEFLILIPDTDITVAEEIAEQVRKGVEKMRFISSKSKRRLPKVTISLGVSSFDIREDWSQFMSRMSETVRHAKSKGKNQVVTQTIK